MIVRFWGTRGSLATPGSSTVRFGGDTASVEIRSSEAGHTHVVALDAGTGIRRLGDSIGAAVERVDVLLSHLHMDHIQGLGFFAPLFRPDFEVHVWGPATVSHDLQARLRRYLSPPLFPVRLHELPCDLHLHDLPIEQFELPGLRVKCDFVCHPGLTVGFRLDDGHASVAYLPDHEPALGVPGFPTDPAWTSGYGLARDVDLLIHDAQYTEEQYENRLGWGHSTLAHACTFAAHVGARCLAAFHHDPAHDDEMLEALIGRAQASDRSDIEIVAAVDDGVVELGAGR